MMAGFNSTGKLSGSVHMFAKGFGRGGIGAVLGMVAILAAGVAQGQPCVIPDNGSGTVDLPPVGGPECGYLSPDDVHEIIAGLPPGTTIRLGAAHSRFGNIITTPGGPLGGEHEQFTSEVFLQLVGTGELNGYLRTINMINVQVQTDTAPRGTGTPQDFDTDMAGMQGQITGDPDFDLLRITAGTGFGMPSPGHTTLTRQGPPGSPWAVDSFFDIFYRIDFVGAPGGPLGGMSGSTTGTIRMQTGGGSNSCCMPNGFCQPMSQAMCNAQGGSPVSHCPPSGLCIPPSDDCFFTQCGQTNFDFCETPIPADFFYPGSEPFTGLVYFQGASPTDPDTLVRRFDAMLLDGPPETVPIELVQLNLVSCQPITITGSSDTLWSVAVDLSPTPVPQGSMTAAKTHPNGGTFSATFNVQPRFTFTEVGNPGNVRILDTGGVTPPAGFSTTGPAHWVHGASVPTPVCGANFVPGVQEDPATGEQCCTETCHDNPGGGHKHCTKRCFVCPRGACCDPATNSCSIADGAAACAGIYKGDGTNCNDTDGDGLADVFELNDCCLVSTPCNSGSSPTDSDTDDDGVLDGDELALGCDPCVPDCGNACEPLSDGSGCSQTGCACFGECINGSYCDDPACCLDPNNCLCYVDHAPESIKLCGDCFGECIGSSYCDDVADPNCWINPGGAACYAPNTVESIYLCKGCFGECINGSYCDGPDPDCCIDPANCQCYAPTHPISLKMCPNVDRCEAKCVKYNPFTGQNTVTSCDCAGWHDCHVNLPGGTSGRGEVQRGTGNGCVVPDNGGGTVTLPPAGCEYLSPDDVHAIIDGLPPGTTIELGTIHKDFICNKQGTINPICTFSPLVDCTEAGGTLGGEKECAQSGLELTMTGTGALAGYNRALTLPVAFETHVGPRTAGNPVQSFDTDMFRLYGQITGDPDFDLLRIVAGTDFGMPSPGHTTLTQLPGGSWAVDSFFDITYRIDFVGSPGGPLSGMSGSTTATIRMAAGAGPNCVGQCPPGTECQETRVVNADGTIDICCDCVTPPPTCEPSTLDPSGCTSTCPPPVGTDQCLPLTGGCNPNQPGTCGVLSCDCQDPNVCHLVKNTGGGGFHCEGGCPVPPGGTCTLLGDGAFDNPYRCDCIDTNTCQPNADASDCEQALCPGVPPVTDKCQKKCVKVDAAGNIEVTDCECEPDVNCHVETHQGPVPRGIDGGVAGGGANGCIVPNDGGTVDLPPAGCDYLSPNDVHMIIDGLPPNTEIHLAPIHSGIFCREQNNVCSFPPGIECEQSGGTLGGQMECASSDMQFQLQCVSTGPGGCPGALSGWNRPVMIPNVGFETHVGPRTPGQPVQSFDTDMFRLFGQITNPGSGDPDFDLLRIVAGTDFGLPSPGHTTLTKLPGPNFAVDSFFDITYRIDFVGRTGGMLGGMSGSTTGTIRMQTTPPVKCVGDCPVGTTCEQTDVPQADGTNKICCDCVGVPQVCEPNATGTDCNPVQCPMGPVGPETCRKKCVTVDAVGNVTVTDCDCQADFECHVELGTPGAPRGVGMEFDGGVAGGPNGCIVVDDGSGTVDLPPVGCDYLSPDEVHMIIDGLPAGTTINLAPIHQNFICNKQPGGNGVCSFPPGVECEQSGGSLGGQQECADSTLHFDAHCVGPGCGAFNDRPIDIPISFETHIGPRTPGNPVQSFDTDMFRLFGQITGDPDFDLLRVVGGTDFGLPSPGHTTLTRLPGGNWAVDSFFDITYRIDFVGRPGGPLGGMSGSTTATIRMQTNAGFKCRGQCPAPMTCEQSNVPQPDGTNKICCDCVDANTGACCLDDGTCINTTAANCAGTFLPGVTCSGTVEACCDPSGISCTMRDPACCTASGGTPMGPGSNCSGIQTGCCLPGNAVTPPSCIMADPQCCTNAGGTPQFGEQCSGNQACCLPNGTCMDLDPICCDDAGGTSLGAGSVCLGDSDGNGADDACERCEPTPDGTGCTNFCPPSPILEDCQQRCANFNPLTGQITITECDCRGTSECHLVYPGGSPARAVGEAEGIVAGGPNGCVEPDASGTVVLPPPGLDCPYVSPDDFHEIVDGLPPGTTIQVGVEHSRFVNISNAPGGSLGGEVETFDSSVILTMNGECTGPPNPLCSYSRNVAMMNVPCVTHIGPRTPGQAVQSFDTQMFSLQGQLPPGDPDFDLLRITAGSGFGMPSPGHTTLTRLGPPGSEWAVDSFFDVFYRIDFVGAPGGPFGGMSGSTTGTIRMGTSAPFKCVGGCGPRRSCTPKVRPNPDGTLSVCCDCRPKRPNADPSLYNKPRFVSFAMAPAAVAGGAEENAIRVRLVSLHHVMPPYSGGPSIPFTAFEGQVRYAGPPAVFVESTSSGIRFVASQLQCAPHYRDWTAFNSCSLTPTICTTNGDCPMGGTCTVPVDALLHVTGSAITPSSVFEIEVLGSSCAGVEDTCEDVSDPLQIGTTRWGDLEIPFNPPSLTVQPDVGDISALVNKFRNAPGAPIKARALLTGLDQFGTINLSPDFSFSHIAACVDAFRGLPYPHTIQACP